MAEAPRIPPELLRSDLRDAILAAVSRAYEVNQERHDPKLGDTPLSFGILVWTSSTLFLSTELGQLRGVECSVVNNSIEIRVGRCRLRSHKLGRSAADDPWRCFPDHVGPAARMGRVEQIGVQLDLDLDPELVEALDWVIGHYGSCEEGLEAVRLQAVDGERCQEDGRVTRWSAIDTIYEVKRPADVDLTVLEGGQADAVPIPEPEVAIREKGELNSDNERP